MYHADTSLEPVTQHSLSECLAQSDLLPKQGQGLYNFLQEDSGVFRSSITDLTSTPFVKHYIDTGNAKPIKKRTSCTSHNHRTEIGKKVSEILQYSITKPSVIPWASLVVLARKADKTLGHCIDYWNLIKATIKDSYILSHIKNTLDLLYGKTCSRPLSS